MMKFNLKIFSITVLILLIGFSVLMLIKKPQLHKQIQVNIIEYIIKINKDGSVTKIKSIQTDMIKEK